MICLSVYDSDLYCFVILYLFPMAFSHRVDVLSQDRYVGFPHKNLLRHLLSDVPVLEKSPYTDGRSSTALFFVLVDDISIRNGLGQGEYRGAALQLVSEPSSEQM